MATPKKSNKLADLTASLAARTGGAPAPQTGVSGGEMTPPPTVPEDALVPNQSVSLYESDLDLLEQVRGWLSKRGVRGCNASEAVRLCVRLAAKEENGDSLATLCREARAKDGRKTRWKKG